MCCAPDGVRARLSGQSAAAQPEVLGLRVRGVMKGKRGARVCAAAVCLCTTQVAAASLRGSVFERVRNMLLAPPPGQLLSAVLRW